MMSKFRAYLERIKERYTADELFRANEVEANGLAMKYLIVNAVIFLLVHAGVTAGRHGKAQYNVEFLRLSADVVSKRLV